MINKMSPFIGQEVYLESLLFPGKHIGKIINIRLDSCVVKLDRQQEPVYGVDYYDIPPKEIIGWHLQICYPIMQLDMGKVY